MKKLVFFSLIAALSLQLLTNGQVLANMDTTEQLIKQTKAIPVEYGVTAVFEFNGEGSGLADEITERTGFLQESKSNSWGEYYSIKSKDDNINIEIKLVENRGEVQFKTSNRDAYGKTKNILNEALLRKNIRPQYYEYIKCTVKEGNLSSIYSKINTMLISKGTKNLKSTAINNGYSITGFTGYGKTIPNRGNLIDISIAVISYKSGNYLIIGTPEIMAAY